MTTIKTRELTAYYNSRLISKLFSFSNIYYNTFNEVESLREINAVFQGTRTTRACRRRSKTNTTIGRRFRVS
jgi:hypothetical protein